MRLSEILMHCTGLEYVCFYNSELELISTFSEVDLPQNLLSSCFDDWYFVSDQLGSLKLCVLRKDL